MYKQGLENLIAYYNNAEEIEKTYHVREFFLLHEDEISSTFNLKNIYYFPSCSSGTISLHLCFLRFPLDIWKPGRGGELPYEKAEDAHRKI